MPEPTVQMKMECPDDARLPSDIVSVGLDFGTTNTGIAYQHATCDQPLKDIELRIRNVRGWPNRHGPDHDESKVPTILRYDEQGKVVSWGYEAIGGDGIAIEWFKLAIIPAKDLPPNLRNAVKLKETRKTLSDMNVNVTKVIEDYITSIWKYARGEMEKFLRRRILQSIPIHVVIAIPAMWGNQAIDTMKNALASNILASSLEQHVTYNFISEPEAALQAYGKELQAKLDVGEIVTVADLGGGTVDMISYKKVGEGAKGFHLQLEEAVTGQGALCGGMFADEAFEKLLSDRLWTEHKLNIKRDDPEAWRRIISEQWHNIIKPTFTWKATGQIWPVIFSNFPTKKVDLTEDDVRDVFECSVMPGIFDLINQQIKQLKKEHNGRGPGIIIPVGGFGRCLYIHQRLREEFGGAQAPSKKGERNLKKKKKMNDSEIEILTEKGDFPSTAISQGACLAGIYAQLGETIVTSRKARTSVGFPYSVPCQPWHQGAIQNKDFGGYVIPDIMKWVGDTLTDSGKESTQAMYLPCDFQGRGTRTETSTFYAYDGEHPPERLDFRDEKFQDYGVMSITASKSIEELPIFDSGAERRRNFDYNLRMKVVGGSVDITATSAHPDDEGKEVGKVVLSGLEEN
ncbi:hypothetical protein N8I77_013288 [Diaporthe amygdali]|uniref:Actin-like ATPase domain-containing protein n=1 Tax=Phomopsis amygdali TaxID=1214568 RepID=A0AAD9S2I0_PHOAM|nr:hypothetical protein N8I77_013288 [Diaporthe amygdali]